MQIVSNALNTNKWIIKSRKRHTFKIIQDIIISDYPIFVRSVIKHFICEQMRRKFSILLYECKKTEPKNYMKALHMLWWNAKNFKFRICHSPTDRFGLFYLSEKC